MQFKFSLRTSLICLTLIVGMLRAAFWQWERHNAKTVYISTLENRLKEPVADLPSLLASDASPSNQNLIHRRVLVTGKYDYPFEVVLRNRRHDDEAGVNIITPLRIDGTDRSVLVNRGFVPLSLASKEARAIFKKGENVQFVGLIKATQPPRLLAPKDPPSGKTLAWVDSWLRVDIEAISEQLPYELLPFYLEIIPPEHQDKIMAKMIHSGSERDEMLFFPTQKETFGLSHKRQLLEYPVAVFDTVVPPGRHLGYVFEWSAMAFATMLIGLVLQFKRPTDAGKLLL